jgi:thioredoxin-related protein
MMGRRLTTAGLAVAIVLLSACANAEPLPLARDLAADARLAALERTPIMVFFASRYCPYCGTVEDLYLRPMQQRGELARRVVLRMVVVESSEPLRDFAGALTRHEAFAQREAALFTPTIRFYGPDGKELAPALRGYSSADYYLGELEAAIERAVAALQPATAQRP